MATKNAKSKKASPKSTASRAKKAVKKAVTNLLSPSSFSNDSAAGGKQIGRPAGAEAGEKVTVVLFQKHLIKLDEAILNHRKQTGRPMSRSEILRAAVDAASFEDIASLIQPQ